MGIKNTIFGRKKSRPTIIKIDTRITGVGSTDNKTIRLIQNAIFTGEIDWGDGAVLSYVEASVLHTYTVEGIYIITITPIRTKTYSLNLANNGDNRKFLEIIDFGAAYYIAFQDFKGAINLDLASAAGIPNIVITDFSNLFDGCNNLTSVNGINDWNTANVTKMEFMFSNCTKFNQSLSFNSSKNTSTFYMFSQCKAYNKPIYFDTSKVTNMQQMFDYASAYNQPVTFSTAAATSLVAMFRGTAMNPTNFTMIAPFATQTGLILLNCVNFNPTIFHLETPLGNDSGSALAGCNAFAPNVFYMDADSSGNLANLFSGKATWNPTDFYLKCRKATNLSNLFGGCLVFNPSNTFDLIVRDVTNFGNAFQSCRAFNKSLSNVYTGSCTYMGQMFDFCWAFNQDISHFDVSKNLSMLAMMRDNYAFNKDISIWNFHKDVDIRVFMAGKTAASYDPVFYSNLLIKLRSRMIGTGRTFTKSIDFGGIKRDSTGTASRLDLIADGWSISDGGI